MKIVIEVPEEEIKDKLVEIIAEKYYRTFSTDRRIVDKVVAEQVRKIIYEDKERIVNRIVDQASRECKNKAIKKILDSLED